MTKAEQFDAINAEYEGRFGEDTSPGMEWLNGHFNGDVSAYCDYLRQAIKSGVKIQDFEAAHRIPAGALT